MDLAPAPASVRELIASALEGLGRPSDPRAIIVERPKNPAHGHYASNVALLEGKRAGQNPRQIAGELAAKIGATGAARVEVAGPGFLNFTLPAETYHRLLADLLADPPAGLRAEAVGRDETGRARRVLVEFVSANPTGPLNVVSARAAAVGDTLARLLDASGFAVEREFYVNDHGNQADLLGESLRLALYATEWPRADLPEGGYGGAYILDLANAAKQDFVNRDHVIELPQDESGRDDALVERLLEEGSGLYERAKELQRAEGRPLTLSKRGLRLLLREFAIERIVAEQKADLASFGVAFDRWFRESDLHRKDAPRATLESLRERGHVYEADGATWFRSTAFGDDQDRVLAKAGGVPTYFLSDVAYHGDKRSRGYDMAIDLWGPDHHGHIPRLTWAVEAAGAPKGWLEILVVQQVNLIRHGEVVKMSKRKGEFVTLRDVMEELSKGKNEDAAALSRDVARWFFLMRRSESHLDFDLVLAVSESDENPVYYVQYAHARIAGLFAHAREMGAPVPEGPFAAAALAPLVEPEAVELIRVLQEARATVVQAALAREPHRMTAYLTEVATAFHGFYHHHQVVVLGDERTTRARLALCRGTQAVIGEGLSLLGISAPERM